MLWEFRNGLGLRGLPDLHLDALAELERNGPLEGDADGQDAGVGGAAGVVGTDPPGDQAIGDLLDSPLPGLAGVTLRGDRDGASRLTARDVKRVNLGLDVQSCQIDDAEQGGPRLRSRRGSLRGR